MKRFGLGAALLALLAGCAGELRSGGNIGGANAGVKRAGNVPGGIAVRNGDIAVSPKNSFFVTLRDGLLVLGDLAKKDATTMTDLPKPNRLARGCPNKHHRCRSLLTFVQSCPKYLTRVRHCASRKLNLLQR